MSHKNQHPQQHIEILDLDQELDRIDGCLQQARKSANQPQMSYSATVAIEQLCDAVDSLRKITAAACGHMDELSETVSSLTGEGLPLEYGPLVGVFAPFVEHVTQIRPLIEREPTRDDGPPLVVIREDQPKSETGSSGTRHTKGRLHIEIFAEHADELGQVLCDAISDGRYDNFWAASDPSCEIMYAKVLETERSATGAVLIVVDALVRSS